MQMDPPPTDQGWKTRMLRKFGLRTKKAEMPAVFTMGATNLVETLDAALLRPGRFDWKIQVERPSFEGWMEVLEYYLAKVKTVPNLPMERIAIEMITPEGQGYSPVEVKFVVNEAVVHAHFDGREAITYEDMRHAMETREYGLRQKISGARSRTSAVAYHEAGHAIAMLGSTRASGWTVDADAVWRDSRRRGRRLRQGEGRSTSPPRKSCWSTSRSTWRARRRRSSSWAPRRPAWAATCQALAAGRSSTSAAAWAASSSRCGARCRRRTSADRPSGSCSSSSRRPPAGGGEPAAGPRDRRGAAGEGGAARRGGRGDRGAHRPRGRPNDGPRGRPADAAAARPCRARRWRLPRRSATLAPAAPPRNGSGSGPPTTAWRTVRCRRLSRQARGKAAAEATSTRPGGGSQNEYGGLSYLESPRGRYDAATRALARARRPGPAIGRAWTVRRPTRRRR